jgi:hypothetical protein
MRSGASCGHTEWTGLSPTPGGASSGQDGRRRWALAATADIYLAIASSMDPLGQQLFHPTPVRLEAADHLPVNHQRGRGTAFPLIHQLIVGARICLDVLPLVGDAPLPKELLGRPAIPSTGLVVQNHLLHGMFLPFSWAQAAIYG